MPAQLNQASRSETHRKWWLIGGTLQLIAGVGLLVVLAVDRGGLLLGSLAAVAIVSGVWHLCCYQAALRLKSS